MSIRAHTSSGPGPRPHARSWPQGALSGRPLLPVCPGLGLRDLGVLPPWHLQTGRRCFSEAPEFKAGTPARGQARKSPPGSPCQLPGLPPRGPHTGPSGAWGSDVQTSHRGQQPRLAGPGLEGGGGGGLGGRGLSLFGIYGPCAPWQVARPPPATPIAPVCSVTSSPPPVALTPVSRDEDLHDPTRIVSPRPPSPDAVTPAESLLPGPAPRTGLED